MLSYLSTKVFDAVEQRIASLFGVSKQHGCVGVVENWVVYRGVANTHRPLHYYHLKLKITLVGLMRSLQFIFICKRATDVDNNVSVIQQ